MLSSWFPEFCSVVVKSNPNNPQCSFFFSFPCIVKLKFDLCGFVIMLQRGVGAFLGGERVVFLFGLGFLSPEMYNLEKWGKWQKPVCAKEHIFLSWAIWTLSATLNIFLFFLVPILQGKSASNRKVILRNPVFSLLIWHSSRRGSVNQLEFCCFLGWH